MYSALPCNFGKKYMHINVNSVALSTLTVLCGHHHYAFPELLRLFSQKFGSHETITPLSSLSSAPGNHYPTLCFCICLF